MPVAVRRECRPVAAEVQQNDVPDPVALKD
jgi:hypothetical protein